MSEPCLGLSNLAYGFSCCGDSDSSPRCPFRSCLRVVVDVVGIGVERRYRESPELVDLDASTFCALFARTVFEDLWPRSLSRRDVLLSEAVELACEPDFLTGIRRLGDKALNA